MRLRPHHLLCILTYGGRGYTEAFVENIPFYGFAVLCLDHPAVQSLTGRIEDRRIVTYGFSPQADVRAVNLTIEPGGAHFDVEIASVRAATEEEMAHGHAH